MRAYRRKAKIVYYVTWAITAVLAATVAASKWHPVIALVAGVAFGSVTGAIAGVIVAAWPVIRAIWWWTPETVIAGSLVFGWIELAGSGAVHPNVLKGCGVDPEIYTGFAFGLGLDRVAMLLYEFPDLRLLLEGDERFLSQFGREA